MLLDVSEGFAIKYVNTAWTRLTGLTQQHASGTTFWDLFGNVAPGGGASQAEVQEAVRSRRPFTVTCGLLPMAMAESTCFSGRAAAAAGPGQLSSSRLAGAAFSSSSGGSGEGVFSATFTPASAPEFRPDEQFLGIPVVVPAAGAAGASGDPSRSLWFATLQQRPSPPPSAPTGSSVSSTVGSPAYGCASTAAFSSCSMEHLRPRNMQGATLGPLLGAGANGRCVGASRHCVSQHHPEWLQRSGGTRGRPDCPPSLLLLQGVPRRVAEQRGALRPSSFLAGAAAACCLLPSKTQSCS